jgi:hypothetical protein
VFRSRRATSIRILTYDGQGFWLAQKRLSKGRFLWWPTADGPSRTLEAYQAQLLIAAGNPDTQAAPIEGDLLLIWDRLPAQRSRVTQQFIREQKCRLESSIYRPMHRN